MEGISVTFSLEILVGLDEASDERPRERGEPLVPGQIGRDAAQHIAEEVLPGVHRGGAAVVAVEQLRHRSAVSELVGKRSNASDTEAGESRGRKGSELTAKAEKEVDGAPGRRSHAGFSSARSSPFFARPACPALTVGRSPPASRSADASRCSRAPSATLPGRRLPPDAAAPRDADILARSVRSRVATAAAAASPSPLRAGAGPGPVGGAKHRPPFPPAGCLAELFAFCWDPGHPGRCCR
jgi:hypothetical protein